MGFCIEDPISGLTISHIIYEAALIIAVLRWVLCWAFRLFGDRTQTEAEDSDSSPSSSSSWVLSSEMIRESSLILTKFGDIVERLPETWDTCCVCLNHLRMDDQVRELRNCCHVFHKECIDRWLDHDVDNHNPTCPLCRAPLLNFYTPSDQSSYSVPVPQPSWAVERLLYLFGEDLVS
ncbi:E3 ubiquitin-protein ligase RHA1B [Quillaja saponaria]|uniref:E3 ubiquitin-protein ligase RHA1B n=1 Tax=Quillaja saponaria TaxID=32244 RepID=A0AAD7PH14_QUISA|nr:E3 ubiquitin-protein ligase RHA1B [Quillaja saponaria]